MTLLPSPVLAIPPPTHPALPGPGGDPPAAHEGAAGLLRPLRGGHARSDRAGEVGVGGGEQPEKAGQGTCV